MALFMCADVKQEFHPFVIKEWQDLIPNEEDIAELKEMEQNYLQIYRYSKSIQEDLINH